MIANMRSLLLLFIAFALSATALPSKRNTNAARLARGAPLLKPARLYDASKTAGSLAQVPICLTCCGGGAFVSLALLGPLC